MHQYEFSQEEAENLFGDANAVLDAFARAIRRSCLAIAPWKQCFLRLGRETPCRIRLKVESSPPS